MNINNLFNTTSLYSIAETYLNQSSITALSRTSLSQIAMLGFAGYGAICLAQKITGFSKNPTSFYDSFLWNVMPGGIRRLAKEAAQGEAPVFSIYGHRKSFKK